MKPSDTVKGAEQVNLLFADFLAYLHRQGFIIGVDHHLRLQVLLNKLGPGCKPADLKFLLCPIFATNKKQQKQFYRAFDSFFKHFDVTIKKKPAPDTAKKKEAKEFTGEVKTRKWPYVFVGLLLLVIVGLTGYWLGDQPKIEDKTPKAEAGEKITPSPEAGDVDPDRKTKPGKQETSFAYAKLWTEKIDLLNNTQYEPTFYRRYGYIFRLIVILAPFIIFLLMESYKYNRRRLILLKERGRKPPYVWPITIETPEKGVVKNEQFHRAARLLRQRLKSDVTRIDMDKTIAHTIETAGFPAFRYKAVTRPPEYLILIDLPAHRDHYAHLFDAIARALEKEGLFVTRYFYENDPRVCFKEPEGERVYLSDLKTRFSDHRLIIFGNGEELLEPVSGGLDKWTGLFQSWRERAVLTPERPKNWGMREVALAKEFILLPASINGLAALKDHFDMAAEPHLKSWKTADSQTSSSPPGAAAVNHIDALRPYLGEETFQWLCACAVYPELHWDLTLYLGALPCMPANLISEENLLQLVRLPWFRSGSMPDECRWALINRLDPGKGRVIRSAIVDLLEKNPAPKNSFAYNSYRLHLVVQKWMLSGKDRKKRKEMLKSLKTANEEQVIRDYTLLRFMESAPGSPLNFILPKRLRKLFYRGGVPLFGFKTGIRIFLTALIAAAFFLLLKVPQKEPHIPVNLTFKPRGGLFRATFSPDGTKVFLWGDNKTAQMMDLAGKPLKEFKHGDTLRGATFSPDGTKILTWSSYRTVRLWDAKTGEQIGPVPTHNAYFMGATFSPDGTRILTWSNDNTVRLSDLPGNPLLEFKHGDSVLGAAFNADGRRILTWSSDKTVRLWDARTGEQIGPVLKNWSLSTKPTCSPDGTKILTWTSNKTARLWDARTGEQIGSVSMHKDYVFGAAFSPDGTRILTWSNDNTAGLSDLTGNPLLEFKHGGSVRGAIFNADGRRILTWSSDGTARLWNAKDGSPEARPVKHYGIVNGAAFSKDGRSILAWSRDGIAKLVSIDPFLTGKKYNIPKYPDLVPLKGGTFFMGAGASEKNSKSPEKPQHKVRISPFAIGRYEVTNAQFVQFLNEKGNREEGGGAKIKSTSNNKFEVEKGFENHPVVGVSWYGARAYCNWLTEETHIPFRLPTEAEWEYACRAGTKTQFSFGDDSKYYREYGWFSSNTGSDRPHEAGQKISNPFGLFDMHGNMWEWCLDGWSPNYRSADGYGRARPVGDQVPVERVVRGGSWKNPVVDARSANRGKSAPVLKDNQDIGFRVAASIDDGYTVKKEAPDVGDSSLWERNTQLDGYFAVIRSYEIRIGLEKVIEDVNRLRKITRQDVQLCYAVNKYYAAVIGIFGTKKLAREKCAEMKRYVPDAYPFEVWGFPYKYKLKDW